MRSGSCLRLAVWRPPSPLARLPSWLFTPTCSERRRNLLPAAARASRSEEHTSELQSLMRISYAVFCLKKKNIKHINRDTRHSYHIKSSLSNQHLPLLLRYDISI